MKKLFPLLVLCLTTSAFSQACTINIARGANFPDFVENHVKLKELVADQQQKLSEKGYELLEIGEADLSIRVELTTVVDMDGWYLRQADAYSLDKDGQVGDIDVYSKALPFIGTAPKELIKKTLNKVVKALPECKSL